LVNAERRVRKVKYVLQTSVSRDYRYYLLPMPESYCLADRIRWTASEEI